MFLTTNRVGHFDDAFVSRIHVVLSYDHLSENDRKDVWKQFFKKLEDEREDFVIKKRAKTYIGIIGDDEDAVCKLKWNGRDIRNGMYHQQRTSEALQKPSCTDYVCVPVFQTAVALAEYRYQKIPNKTEDDCPTLEQEDFEQVCQMTRQFKNYLSTVHNASEAERAYSLKARALPEDEV